LNREERVLNTINRKNIDFLPSQITFSDRTRLDDLAKVMGFKDGDEVEEYLQNHIKLTYSTCDMPLFNRSNINLMKQVEKMGFVKVDLENGVVYDVWGVGIEMFSDGIFPCFHPLQSNDKKIVEKWMPDNLSRDFLNSTVEDIIKKYKAPDPNKKDNFYFAEKDIKEYSGEYLVVPSGYAGIYERAYFLMGYEEFMMNLALNPSLIEDLLDKITDYKIEIAKGFIKLGIKVGHTGDDLGTQLGTMFSKQTFQKILKPRIERLWKVYKDAGLPVMFHSCGNVTEFIPDLIEIGLDVLEPVQPVMDLSYLKREFGRDITFWGGIDTQKVLPYGKPEEVRKLASETIKILGKGGGYIIATAQEVMKDVPIENVKALVETIIYERERAL
jgi:uroporphyrinogen decarboxylase